MQANFGEYVQLATIQPAIHVALHQEEPVGYWRPHRDPDGQVQVHEAVGHGEYAMVGAFGHQRDTSRETIQIDESAKQGIRGRPRGGMAIIVVKTVFTLL